MTIRGLLRGLELPCLLMVLGACVPDAFEFSGGGGGGAGGEGAGVPTYATFHLNLSATRDLSFCELRDFVIFDLEGTPAADFEACGAAGARTLGYFSCQYESWRSDAGDFGRLGGPLPGREMDFYVDPTDSKNLDVMFERLRMATDKGCHGVVIDEVGADGFEDYVLAIFGEARARGLLIAQANGPAKVGTFYDHVDLYVTEACQESDVCRAWEYVRRPVYDVEYTSPCRTFPFMFSHLKYEDVLDAWEGECAP